MEKVVLEQCHGIHVEKSHVIRAKYLIGCDGAFHGSQTNVISGVNTLSAGSKSWVRQKAGISMVEMDDCEYEGREILRFALPGLMQHFQQHLDL